MTGYNYYYDCNYQSGYLLSVSRLLCMQKKKSKRIHCVFLHIQVSPFLLRLFQLATLNANYWWLFLFTILASFWNERRRKNTNTTCSVRLWTDINRTRAEKNEHTHVFLTVFVLFKDKKWMSILEYSFILRLPRLKIANYWGILCSDFWLLHTNQYLRTRS